MENRQKVLENPQKRSFKNKYLSLQTNEAPESSSTSAT